MVYTLRFFSLKCSLFHNSNLFGSCIIHILYTECAKIKKNNSGAKRLIKVYLLVSELYIHQNARCNDKKTKTLILDLLANILQMHRLWRDGRISVKYKLNRA